MKIVTFPTGLFGVNTYIVSNDETKECIIIDPGGSFDIIKKTIERHNLVLKHILLTHGHFDHIGALNELRKHYDVDVFAHEECSKAIMDAKLNISAYSNLTSQQIICKAAENIIEDGLEFSLCSFDIKAIHAPGHSKGSTVFLIEDCAFTGDVLFRLSIGRTDFYGGDMDIMKLSLNKLKKILAPDTKILPGHNDESVFSYELEHNPYLR